MTIEKLYERSLEVIKEGQHRSGGYVASPTFPTYNYSWFRDGSYIAYSMDLAGESESSEKFHNWAVENILKRENELNDYLEGRREDYSEILHTRYTLAGEEGSEDWENFQLDSFGVWIWSLEEHLKLSGRAASESARRAVALVSSYLKELWQKNCYDCWEENKDKIHIYTLATIYRGLISAGSILDSDNSVICRAIEDRIKTKGCHNGHLVKYEGTDAVDSNLLGLFFPCNFLAVDHPVMKKTFEKITDDLYRSGGLHRYSLDTYYGGGIWILLTAWMGIFFHGCGNREKAEEILNWIVEKADERGNLAEQIPDSLNDPDYLPRWIDKWGESADPLLWSHAMYIILYKRLIAS